MEKSYKLNPEYRYIYTRDFTKTYKIFNTIISQSLSGIGYVQGTMEDFGDFVKASTVLSKLIRVMHGNDT